MVYYERSVRRSFKKGEIPKQVLKLFHNAFLSLDLTKDLNLFDIKKLKGNYKREYFRLRKGKFRAIFYVEHGDFHVVYVGKRDEVYDLWQ